MNKWSAHTQVAAAMAVPIQDAVFWEVYREDMLLAGFLDNENLPNGPYQAVFTGESLVGEGGEKVLKGCTQIAPDGSRLSKQQMFATYGL